MNVIVLKGRITKDLDKRTTQSGTSVLSFDLAVDKNYQKAGEERVTYWHRCVCWDRNADNIAKFFQKGDAIVIKGELQDNNFTDADGNKHYGKQIAIESWDFAEKARRNEGSEWQQAPIDEDLPFN